MHSFGIPLLVCSLHPFHQHGVCSKCHSAHRGHIINCCTKNPIGTFLEHYLNYNSHFKCLDQAIVMVSIRQMGNNESSCIA